MPENCVLTVGKFESIHRGHQALINAVVQQARQSGLVSAVVAFSPHPYLALGQGAYKPLLTQAERLNLLDDLNVDYFLEYPFDTTLQQMNPDDFIGVLFHDLKAQTVVVGAGFCFGRERAGTVPFLQEQAAIFGRKVQIIPEMDGISTSIIRKQLDECLLEQAADRLGFPFFATGIVSKGRQLGRTLHFPTLNLYPPPEKYLPRHGVYVTRTLLEGQAYPGITNIGLRPTVNATETVPTIETFLLDFDKDVYGMEICVEFLHFIREEKKFPGLEALKKQIGVDVEKARGFLC